MLLILITGAVILHIKKQDTSALVSPVLGLSSNEKIADNIWFPKESSASADPAITELITSDAAFFVETTTGQVLFQYNPHQKLRIASLIKIMTAIIALEHRDLSYEYTVSSYASSMEPDKMFLQPNEKLTLEELLSGIFLVSANDAAEVLAEGTTGSRDNFISLMNKKARSLGMHNTLFINPSGLEEDDPEKGNLELRDHYSTAYDVLLMSHYLIRNWPDIVKISSSDHIYLPPTQNHQDYDMYTGINLLTTYPGVMGLKTGFTPEAGLTLVTLARRGDKEVIGVLLGSESRRDDAKVLLDYSFAKLGL